MSKKYKFNDKDKIYSVSFEITKWIYLFIRNDYRKEILNSIHYNPVEAGFVTKAEEWNSDIIVVVM